MIQFYSPQTRKWLDEPVRDQEQSCNTACEERKGVPGHDEEPMIDRVPAKKEKNERHWLVTAVPIWILVIAVFVFLVWERHLTAYVDGKKVIDISYTLYGNTLNNIVFYDQNENQAAQLSGSMDWGVNKLVCTRSGSGDDIYMDCYYVNGMLAARAEHYGNNSRTIKYSEDGLIETLEETINGVTYVYTFKRETIEIRDENQLFIPEHLMDRCYHDT